MNILDCIGTEIPLGELLAEHDAKRGVLRLKSVSADELMRMSLPQAEYVIFPWLRVGQTAILSARAGVGKTYLMLSVAKIICEAGTLFDGRWSAPFHRTILYLDGEMAATDMRTRMQAIGLESPLFNLASCDLLPADRPSVNLVDQSWQDALITEIRKTQAEVVILDNLASLYTAPQTNQMEYWAIMQSFILRLRRMKIAVIIVDHEGKSDGGGPRGTSAKADIAHAMISLRRPTDYSPEQGCRFEVHFTKTRGFSGEAAAPFEVQLCGGEWSVSDVLEPDSVGRRENVRKPEAMELRRSGAAVKDISKQLDVPEKTLYRWFGKTMARPHDDF